MSRLLWFVLLESVTLMYFYAVASLLLQFIIYSLCMHILFLFPSRGRDIQPFPVRDVPRSRTTVVEQSLY